MTRDEVYLILDTDCGRAARELLAIVSPRTSAREITILSVLSGLCSKILSFFSRPKNRPIGSIYVTSVRNKTNRTELPSQRLLHMCTSPSRLRIGRAPRKKTQP